jgi:dihydroxyacetone kinase
VKAIDRLRMALLRLADDEEALRDLDARIGDGDLGFTVAEGSRAVVAVIDEAPVGTDAGELLRESAKAFGSANPSTFAALVQSALLEASRVATTATPPLGEDARSLALLLTAATTAIARRGKAELGDKTVLDAIDAAIPVSAVAETLDSELFAAMSDAARSATERLAAEVSRRGRAAWLQERSRGAADPGSVAFVMFQSHLAGR